MNRYDWSESCLADAVLIAAILLVFVIAGTLSYEDEVARSNNYSQQVECKVEQPTKPNPNYQEGCSNE